jgi:hypothetical protein
MTTRSSIKGSIVASHAEVLNKYLAESRPSDSVLARYFKPGDLEILAKHIDKTDWYDIQFYQRMMEFLRDYPGGGDNQYLVQAGRRSAENLINAGVHLQFEYLRRTQHQEVTDPRERFLAFGRDLRLLTTIARSILNFSTSAVREDPEFANRWIIEHSDARDYPEILCWTTQGFTNRMAEEHSAPDLWRWERLHLDRIEFRMNRDA